MYENNIVMNQNTRNNKTTGKPINVSYRTLTFFMWIIMGIAYFLLPFFVKMNDIYDADTELIISVVCIIAGIFMIFRSIFIMAYRKLTIVEDKIFYTTMFNNRNTYSIDDVKKAKIVRTARSREYKIVITIDDIDEISVYKDCRGYDELKRYFCNKGKLVIDGMKVSSIDE